MMISRRLAGCTLLLFSIWILNGCGGSPSLTVGAPPLITQAPSAQTVTIGQTATFAVAATGATSLTYQWWKNGTAVSGATSDSYTTPAASAADNSAQFQVVIKGPFGSTTSPSAVLTVH